MSKLLLATALAALSVSKLEAELKKGYPAGTLEEALGLEKAKEEPRKTAIEALEEALENAKPQTPAEETPAEETPAEETPAEETPAEETPAEETPAEETPAEEKAAGPVIAKGKSLTSLKGILGEGTPVSPDMFPGGQETFDDLKDKGFIE